MVFLQERETLCLWVVPSWGCAVPARPGGGALTVTAVGSAFLACGRGPHCVWNHIFLTCCVVRTDVRSRVEGVSWLRLGLRQPLHLSCLAFLICKTPVIIQNETKKIYIEEPCLKFLTQLCSYSKVKAVNMFDKLRSLTQKYGINNSWCEPW